MKPTLRQRINRLKCPLEYRELRYLIRSGISQAAMMQARHDITCPYLTRWSLTLKEKFGK